MENILTMNQTMFGNKFIERRASKRSRKAQATEFEFSSDVVEMTYDDCDVVDGGGTITINLTISCTLGGFVQGLVSGLITSIVTGLTGGLGAIVGSFIAPLVNKFLIGLFGNSLATVINNACGGGGFSKTFTLKITKWFLPTFSINKGFDLGEILGGACGGGFGPGSSAATSNNYDFAYAN